jgi:hypothetical protein
MVATRLAQKIVCVVKIVRMFVDASVIVGEALRAGFNGNRQGPRGNTQR